MLGYSRCSLTVCPLFSIFASTGRSVQCVTASFEFHDVPGPVFDVSILIGLCLFSPHAGANLFQYLGPVNKMNNVS